MIFDTPADNDILQIYGKLGFSKAEVDESIAHLKEWLKLQPHLPDDLDENILISIVIGCKEGFEQCVQKLDSYISIRGIMPRFFSRRTEADEYLMSVNRNCVIGYMPGFTEDNCRLEIFSLNSTDASLYCLEHNFKRHFLCNDLLYRRSVSAGFYAALNGKCLTVRHLAKSNPKLIKDFMFCLQRIYPIKMKGILFFNTPTFAKGFIENIIKPLLPSKISKRVYVFTRGPAEENQSVVPLELFPMDWGGRGPDSNEVNEYWLNEIVIHKDWIENEGSLTSDESRRIGKCPVNVPYCSVM